MVYLNNKPTFMVYISKYDIIGLSSPLKNPLQIMYNEFVFYNFHVMIITHMKSQNRLNNVNMKQTTGNAMPDLISDNVNRLWIHTNHTLMKINKSIKSSMYPHLWLRKYLLLA